MAWDPKALPWDWDSTSLFQGPEDSLLKGPAPHVAWSDGGTCELETLSAHTHSLCSPSSSGPTASPFGLGLFSPTDSSAENASAQNHNTCLGESLQHKTDRTHIHLPLPNRCNGVFKREKVHKHRNMVNLELSNLSRYGQEAFSEVFLCEQEGSVSPSKNAEGKEGNGSQLAQKPHSPKAGSGASGESFICLELGKRTYFEDPPASGSNKTAPKSVVTNPVKKSRVLASAAQIPRCQVEGCETDLTSAKDYHKRHKVCEMHSKSAVVTVAGQEQRFCQQCSRFHVLSEFDECKRSCRRRLAGHNERRRKPQADVITWNRRSPVFQGDRCLSHFMNNGRSFPPQGLSAISPICEAPNELRFILGNHTWPRVVHVEDQPVYNRLIQNQVTESHLFPSVATQQTINRPPVLFLQSPKLMLPMPNNMAGWMSLPCMQNGHGTISQNPALPSSQGAGLLSSLESATASQSLTRVLDSGCALSLLPSQWWPPHASPSMSLNVPARSSMILDAWIHETPPAGQFVQGQQQQTIDLTPDKLMLINPHSQSICISSVLSGNDENNLGLKEYTRIFTQGSSTSRNLEDHGLRESQGRDSEDVRLTRDMLHASSLSQNNHLHEPFGAFQLGGSYTVELEALRQYDSPMFDSHQML